MTYGEYRKILKSQSGDLGLTYGKFEEENNFVTLPDTLKNKIMLFFDTEQDAIMFKLKYM